MGGVFGIYVRLIKKSAGYLLAMKKLVAGYILASVFLALTEGLSIAFLVPILDAQGDLGRYADLPLVGAGAVWLGGMDITTRLVTVAVMMAVVLAFRGGFQIATQFLNALIPLRLLAYVSRHNMSALLDADVGFVQNRDMGTLRTYFQEHPKNMSGAVQGLAEAFTSLMLLAVYLTIMVTISWKMSVLSLVFVGIVGVVIKTALALPLKRIGERLADAQGAWNTVLMETFLGKKVISLSNAEPMIEERYGKAIDEFVASDLRRQIITNMNGPLVIMLSGIFICTLIAGAAVLNEGNEGGWLTVLVVFIVTLYRMMTPSARLLSSGVMIASQMASFSRLEKFESEARGNTMVNGKAAFSHLRESIRLEGVSFHYEPQDADLESDEDVQDKDDLRERGALHDIDLTFNKGEMVALVGPSGAGKTTLASLLCRLYDPQSGRIMVDGVDLRDLDYTTWRGGVSMVSQDIFLFNDTVLNNVKFGLEDASDKQVREAVRMAAAQEFVEDLPRGWDTNIGDLGVRLSGGQKQRLSIARAVLNNPDVLILDEATSHLDSITEKAIQNTVQELSKGRTVIAIAHRLSTIKKADRIIVMENGRVCEEGNHTELMAKNGRYRELLEHQVLDIEMDAPSAD